MKPTTLFITGTDTGVGKTVLTALLVRYLRRRGIRAAAIKPVCSGGRDDVRALHAAMDGVLTLDEINPWHFRAPMAPLLAARRERRRITPGDVLGLARAVEKHFDMVLIEGAGGLLSPLGELFDSRDLIAALRAVPIIVCPDRLGAVNQVRLVLAALPPGASGRARVVLISPPKPDISTKTNAALLGEFFAAGKISSLPWLGRRLDWKTALNNLRVQQALCALTKI